MNEQIRWITGLLDTHSIPYWIDDGTLLSLTCEGDFYTDDIDISLWSEHESRISNILPLIQNAGYVIKPWSYKHLVYKYHFYPKFVSGLLIDMSLYRKHGDFAWCPAECPMDPYDCDSIPGAVRYSLYRLISPLFGWPTRNWPWRVFLDMGTNWARFYFDNTTRMKNLGILVPHDWESYLEFRYGEFSSVREWRPWKKGGFHHIRQHEFIENVAGSDPI